MILLGAPNAGKSQLLRSLTNATVAVAEYPFTTQVPQPGMARFEDIQIQLVDTPAVTEDYFEAWLPDLVRRADAALLVADLGDEGLLDALEVVIRRLEAVKVCLVPEVPADDRGATPHVPADGHRRQQDGPARRGGPARRAAGVLLRPVRDLAGLRHHGRRDSRRCPRASSISCG